ncbi:MAG: DUF63 family protein [Candidatus Aenigmarchaeota archaeon]|nr:DUF63 family protein [Candidatus Aenigmarchaeota archaeon]
MTLSNFFQNYFVRPIDLKLGYNPVNTLFYSILFVIFTYLVYELLKKLKIKPDKRFILAIIPWVVFGIILRVMEDSGTVRGYLFITPNIWLLFTFLISFILTISKLLEKRIHTPYFKLMFLTGIIFTGLLLPFIRTRNFLGLIYTLIWLIPWVIFLKFVSWKSENKLVLFSQLFDATATFVSIQYFNYFEQHVLPRTIIELTNFPFSFVIVKFVIVVATLKILDRYSEDEEFSKYLKFVIGLLGFITGSRDLLRLIMLV